MSADPSLYDVLGVPPDADCAAIRRAYRARSKQVHPDTGGDVEQFALVKRAHDVLMDGDRRAQYDRTGEADDKPVDNRMAEILQLIAAALDMAMGKAYERGAQPNTLALDRATRIELEGMRTESRRQMGEFEKNVARSKAVMGRFKAPEGAETNLMETILSGRVSYCQSEIAKRKVQQERIGEALAMLDGYTFTADQAPVSAHQLAIDRLRKSMMGAGEGMARLG